jgi:cytochrome b561
VAVEPKIMVKRFTVSERAVHWLTALAFFAAAALRRLLARAPRYRTET